MSARRNRFFNAVGVTRRVMRERAPFLHAPWMFMKRTAFRVRHRTSRARFEEVFRANHWRSTESASGFGSSVAATGDVRAALTEIIEEYSITSLLDIPCGDFNWMRHVEFDGLYCGADIVQELVTENQYRFGTDRRTFIVLDLTVDALPPSDLVLTRDCLNHLSLSEGSRALSNILASGARYAALTHFPETIINRPQPSGFDYRSLNLERAPFDWPPPTRLWREASEPGKTLALWILKDVRDRHR